jgi:hypothetical protein
MFDRPPRRIRRGGFFLGPAFFRPNAAVSNACNDVEAALPSSPGFGWIGGQPGMGTAAQSTLFAFVHRLSGKTMALRFPKPAATLDLDEYEHRLAAHDQIDLDAIRADVARNDAIPSRLEELGGSSLAFTSQFLPWIRHGLAFTCVRGFRGQGRFALIGPAG